MDAQMCTFQATKYTAFCEKLVTVSHSQLLVLVLGFLFNMFQAPKSKYNDSTTGAGP